MITALPAVFAIGSGSLVGIILGLIGGGGSILAVPLLVYAVGVPSTHVAIGTGAVAVALNAGMSLAAHARLGTVKWRCAAVFAAAGVIGALAGAALGKAMNGEKLLLLFGLLMLAVGFNMLRKPILASTAEPRLTRESASRLLPRLIGTGAGVGMLSGFFGIGGGFLIVPGLMLATGMPLRSAISTSLVAVTAFGLATASSYALSGYIDWVIAALFIAGGLAGSIIGTRANGAIAQSRSALNAIFAGVVIAVGVYVVVRGAISLGLF